MRRVSALAVASLAASSIAVVGAAPGPVDAATVPGGFTDSLVAEFSNATTVEWLPSGHVAVLEQSGRLRLGKPGESFSTALTVDACSNSERGLLGVAADPAFLGNGSIYVYYTHDGPSGCKNRVSRFTLRGDTVDASSEVVLLDDIASTGGNHNGGALEFDGDGNLLVGVGDAGRDPRFNSGFAGGNDAAQDLSLLNGKILRITTAGAPAPGNPFSGPGTTPCAFSGTGASASTKCQEIFAWGVRNPWRIAVDRNDGAGNFFFNDVGQGTYEEVNGAVLGADYGWPGREGPCPQGATAPCSGPGAGQTDPITAYGRDLGSYITGGAFVPDGLWPAEFDGAYLFGDGGSGNIWVRRSDGSVDYGQPFATGAFGMTDMAFGFDADGVAVLYYSLRGGGGVRMIRPDTIPAAEQASDLELVPVTPFRAYDTEDGTGVVPGPVFNGTTRLVDLDPPAGAAAALVNLTYNATAGPGFVQTWAARTRRPGTSSLNADRPNTTAANAAVVALDDGGNFVLESATTARVVVDVMGWFVPAGATSDDGRFVALDPGRVADTREPAGEPLASGSANRWTRTAERIDVEVLGELGVPDDGTASAIVLSVGAIAGRGPGGFVGGYPGGTAYTGTSNVNVLAGEVRANMMVIPTEDESYVSLRTLNIADVVVDVLGYVTSDVAPISSTGLYNTIAPERIVDTRIALGFGRLRAQTPAEVGVPTAASGASALVQNVTAAATSGPGWIAASPTRSPSEVSNVNFEAPGQARAAFSFTTVSDDDSVFFTSLVPTDLVVDVVGFFSN